ncbi:hypothetical protein ACD578_30465 (plasmid) [Microvirga sp. RSM25]|uniref:hypothetical protein n=1 Tax=Microvirga sp. RSM25 TaxID=3273802 RepID=UPI00384EE41C
MNLITELIEQDSLPSAKSVPFKGIDMTKDAKQFVDRWIDENIDPTGYTPVADASEAERLARACWVEADKAGISRDAIEDSVGNLVVYIELVQEILAGGLSL